MTEVGRLTIVSDFKVIWCFVHVCVGVNKPFYKTSCFLLLHEQYTARSTYNNVEKPYECMIVNVGNEVKMYPVHPFSPTDPPCSPTSHYTLQLYLKPSIQTIQCPCRVDYSRVVLYICFILIILLGK